MSVKNAKNVAFRPQLRGKVRILHVLAPALVRRHAIAQEIPRLLDGLLVGDGRGQVLRAWEEGGRADQGATPDPTRRAPSFPGTLPRAMPLLAPDPSLQLARAVPGQFKAPPVLPATQLQGVEAMALVKREARSSQFQSLSAHRAGTPTGATGTKLGALIAPPSPKAVALSGRRTVLDRVWPLFWREDQLPLVRDRVLEERC